MPAVVIDAGHGGRDPGATYKGRQEKDDVLELALSVGEILSQNGIDVYYTRTEDEYDTPYEKAVIANNSGADFFVSLHRNAADVPGSGNGSETLVYSDSGLPAEMARNINANLEAVGFTDRGVIERPGLVVLRRTTMPAVLVEAGFIDNEADNELYDANEKKIAEAIADGILETLGESEETSIILEEEEETAQASTNPDVERPDRPIPPPPDVPERPPFPGERPLPHPPVLYKVQVGAYRNKGLAYQLADQLLSEGYPAYVVKEDDLYKVRVGAFENLDLAGKLERRLRQSGYNTYISL